MSDADDLARKYRRQSAVYWYRTGTDSFGDPTYGDPVEVQVRWTDTVEEFLDATGQRTLSNAILFVGDDITPSDVFMLGTLSDVDSSLPPTENPGAYEVKKFSKIPNAMATKYLRKVWL